MDLQLSNGKDQRERGTEIKELSELHVCWNDIIQKHKKIVFLNNFDLISILYIELEYVIEVATPLENIKFVTKVWRIDIRENRVTSLKTL